MSNLNAGTNGKIVVLSMAGEQPMHKTNYPNLKGRATLSVVNMEKADIPFAIVLHCVKGFCSSETLSEAIRNEEKFNLVHKTALDSVLRDYYHIHGNNGLFNRLKYVFETYPNAGWNFTELIRDEDF